MIRRTMSRSGSPTVRRSVRSSALRSGEPLERLGRVWRVAGRVERVAEGGDLGRVDAVGDPDELVAQRGGLARPAAGQRGRAPAEQPQVARPDRPARAGEQGEQRGVGRHVVEQVEGGDHLGHLGKADQAGEADDLDGDVAGGERVEHVGGVGVVAGEHADVGPLRPDRRLVGGLDLVGQPGELVGLGPEHPGGHVALPRVGLGGEAHDLAGVLGVERLGQPVGDLEDPAVGAPTHGQRERGRPGRRASGRCRRSGGCWRPRLRASRRSPGWGRRRR